MFENAGLGRGDEALILGAGGVARAVATAAIDLGMCASISTRDPKKRDEFARQFMATPVPWKDRHSSSAKVLINCTPIGMAPEEESMPVNVTAICNFEVIADLVAKPPVTGLIAKARLQNLRTLPGYLFVLQQAAKQLNSTLVEATQC